MTHYTSDLKGYWFLTYGLRPALVKAFKADIKRVIDLFEKDPFKSDNAVSDFLDKAHRSSVRETNRDNLKKLGALMSESAGDKTAECNWKATAVLGRLHPASSQNHVFGRRTSGSEARTPA